MRFMPYVLHQVCQAQQLNADDPVRCDYWMFGKTDKPIDANDAHIVRIVENLQPDRVASAKGARNTCEMLAGTTRLLGINAGDRLIFADARG